MRGNAGERFLLTGFGTVSRPTYLREENKTLEYGTTRLYLHSYPLYHRLSCQINKLLNNTIKQNSYLRYLAYFFTRLIREAYSSYLQTNTQVKKETPINQKFRPNLAFWQIIISSLIQSEKYGSMNRSAVQWIAKSGLAKGIHLLARSSLGNQF